MSIVSVGTFGQINVSWVTEPGKATIRLSAAHDGAKLVEFELTSLHLWTIYAGTIEEPVPVPLLGLDPLPELPDPDVLSIDDLDFPPNPRYTR
jgi:hypothetical protein